MTNLLIVFARNPILGKVKTRLTKEIGEEKTLEIYNKLLKHTLKESAKSEAITKVYWTEATNLQAEYIQVGKDLGVRMYNALAGEFQKGIKICLIGTDCPFITSQIIEKAFDALDTHDITFGPAKDGGYYLVGMKNVPPKKLFLDKEWSHSNVLIDALEVCKQLNLEVHLLPTLLDIDTKEDVDEWIGLQDDSKA